MFFSSKYCLIPISSHMFVSALRISFWLLILSLNLWKKFLPHFSIKEDTYNSLGSTWIAGMVIQKSETSFLKYGSFNQVFLNLNLNCFLEKSTLTVSRMIGLLYDLIVRVTDSLHSGNFLNQRSVTNALSSFSLTRFGLLFTPFPCKLSTN